MLTSHELSFNEEKILEIRRGNPNGEDSPGDIGIKICIYPIKCSK